MSEPLVIVGNGMAAARLVEELASRGLGRHAVAVIGEEPRLAYNRVLLSSLLAGEIAPQDIELKPARWWRDRGVTLRYGCAATAIDAPGRTVTLADGAQLGFSKLVIATGSRPIRLPIAGMQLPGVLTFRDVDDVAAMTAGVRPRPRAVVIGGGLLGLEAAYGLRKAGAAVTLVHLMDRLMERQLDPEAAAMLRRAVEAKGITVLTGAETARVIGQHRGGVEAVELKDGRVIEADMLVMAVGVTPQVDLARAAGLAVKRGVVVDDRLQTSTAGIFAIGECAEHRGQCYGLVEPAHDQARVLAKVLTGATATYGGNVLATNLKVSGINVFSAGDFLGAPGTEAVTLTDRGLGSYKKLVIADDRLVGAVLFGDTADGLWYLDLIRSGTPIDAIRDDLVFGRALALRQAA
jgi:nitrite reductase (NADH) large subunit